VLSAAAAGVGAVTGGLAGAWAGALGAAAQPLNVKRSVTVFARRIA